MSTDSLRIPETYHPDNESENLRIRTELNARGFVSSSFFRSDYTIEELRDRGVLEHAVVFYNGTETSYYRADTLPDTARTWTGSLPPYLRDIIESRPMVYLRTAVSAIAVLLIFVLYFLIDHPGLRKFLYDLATSIIKTF